MPTPPCPLTALSHLTFATRRTTCLWLTGGVTRGVIRAMKVIQDAKQLLRLKERCVALAALWHCSAYHRATTVVVRNVLVAAAAAGKDNLPFLACVPAARVVWIDAALAQAREDRFRDKSVGFGFRDDLAEYKKATAVEKLQLLCR